MNEARITLFPDALAQRFVRPRASAALVPTPTAELLAQLDALDGERCQRVLFCGGAPMRHPDFDALVRHARARELNGLTLETDGAELAAEGALARLETLGFETLFVVCGGMRARVYETVMQAPGTFRAAFQGLHAALASGLRTYVVYPLFAPNAEDARPLLDWLLATGLRPAGLLLALPEPHTLPEAARKLLPRFRDAAQLAALLFRQCQGRNIEYGFASHRALPPCAAGGALDDFGTVFHERFNFLKHEGERAGDFERLAACASCSLNAACPGFESDYARAHGTDEVEAVPLDVSMNWKLRRINRLATHDYQNVSPFSNDSLANPRGLLRINGHCNMSCAFCFVDRTAPDFETLQMERAIAELRALGTRHLVLSGGEPTLHPDLPRLVAFGRDQGFDEIEMQSNGVKCADPEYARALADAGLTKITVSLHSVDPDKSDEITRLPRAFGKTMEAMHNFRRLGVLTQVAHVITRANFEELPRTVRFLRETFPEAGGHLSICFGIAQGISDLVFAWVIPRFSEVRPYMQEALDYCLSTGVGFGGMIGQGGYPPCMLGGDLRYYEGNLGNVFRSADSDEQFYKADRCRGCSFDAHCVGVRRSYVEHYGDAELVPFQAAIPAAPPPPPPRRATRGPGALPVLG